MKKRLLSLLMALSLLLGMLPASALAAELPDSAAFNGVTADAEGAVQVSEAGAVRVSLNGTDLGESLHQHIVVPEGTEKAYVSYSADSVYAAEGKAYGIACTLPGGSGKAATLPAVTGEDGSVTIEVPVADYLAFANEDGSWEGDAFVPQDKNLQPVNVLSFGFDLEAVPFGGEETVTIPEGAPFTAISSDKGGVKGIEDKGSTSLDGGWMGMVEGMSWYHVTLPTGAKSAQITFADALSAYEDMNSGDYVVAGFYADTTAEPWAGSSTGFGYVDDYTVSIPMSMSANDMMSGGLLELDFTDGWAAAPQDSSYNLICLFTFEYEANDCTHANAPDASCTEPSVCPDCGETLQAALGHDYVDGICKNCTQDDPTVTVTFPEEGYGYRVKGEATASKGESYDFTVSLVDGFVAGDSFAVKVNGQTIAANPTGGYTVANVTEALSISVSGVEQKWGEARRTITMEVSQGTDKFYTHEATGTVMVPQTITVPYFDLALYNLERYYYNPNCYGQITGDNTNLEGNRATQSPGSPEDAYGVVTAIHAFIYATEVFYLGIDAKDAGKGLSYSNGTFTPAISWNDQVAGSSFVKLWDHGTNLNYYLNYEYPLGAPGWGATADQIILTDGDILSMHLIEDQNAAASTFGFFMVDDGDGEFESTDGLMEATVKAGETITLTLMSSAAEYGYETGYEPLTGRYLYWTEEENAVGDLFEEDGGVDEWGDPSYFWKDLYLFPFGATGGEDDWENTETDENGQITLDTTGVTPGVYYIAAEGEVDFFGERGPAVFKLIVEQAGPARDGDVYQLGTAEELLWFAAEVNEGSSDLQAALTADIDLSSVNWTPIGTSSKPFAGSFDGKGHSVTFANASNGLFGAVKGTSSKHAVIANVVIEGSIAGGHNIYVAAVAGSAAYANFDHCVNKASVSGASCVAGIVGYRQSSGAQACSIQITDCRNDGNISGAGKVGGILGSGQGNVTIDGCVNTGSITGGSEAGGLVGYIQGYPGASSVSNSYNRGPVSGAGLIGNLYNNVSVSNCYNAGTAPYGIAGNVYNRTASVSNCYYLSAASAEGVPAGDQFDSISIAAKTRNELGADSFPATLGSSYKAACPFPALSWEIAATHELSDGVCSVCNYGSTEAQTFPVTLPSGTGYTVAGETSATEGESYSFTVVLAEGYMKGKSFTVMVNSETITETNGSYTWAEVQGPLNITVSGVEKIPATHTLLLPAEGYGYRVTPQNGSVDGRNVTVNRGADFRFSLRFVEGFRAGEDFAVKAGGVSLREVDGVYAVSNVTDDQTITVTGVEQIPGTDKIDITMTVTHGTRVFADADGAGTPLALQDLSIPYFDLALYGLEKYYYNPACYTGERQQAGTPEQAYGVVTAMHALIYATEIFRLNVDVSKAGTGISAKDGSLQELIWWNDQPVGSTFASFWEYGTNQNYYVDYVYPLAKKGWGATSDQIALKDGSVLSIHAIADSKASGSNFAFFVAGDEDDTFTFGSDTVDYTTVKQGELLPLTLYRTVNDGSYTTKYTTVASQQLYWIDEDNLDMDVSGWETEGFAGLSEAEFRLNAKGDLTLDTSNLEPGTYYIGALGGLTAGGATDAGGFVSSGDETGAAIFCLTVEENTQETLPGDVTGDGKLNVVDAARVYAACNGRYELSAAQFAAADVNGDGKLNVVDAARIYAACNGRYTLTDS